MLKNKSIRHSIAFVSTFFASGLLIPVVHAGNISLIWFTFGIIILVNIINLLIP